MVSDRKTLQCFGSLWAWVTPLFAWRTGAFCGFGSSDGPEIHIQYSGNSPVDAEHWIFRGERSTIHRNTSPTLSLGTKGGPGMFRLQNNFYLQGHFLSARTSRPFVIRPRADSWVINWVWMSVRPSGQNVSFYQDETLVAFLYSFKQTFFSDPVYHIEAKVRIILSEMSKWVTFQKLSPSILMECIRDFSILLSTWAALQFLGTQLCIPLSSQGHVPQFMKKQIFKSFFFGRSDAISFGFRYLVIIWSWYCFY